MKIRRRQRFVFRRTAGLLVALWLSAAAPRSAATPQLQPPDSAASQQTRSTTVVGVIDGAIGPATKDYVHRVIDESTQLGAECVVFEMDTPGGLSESMRDIIQDILASEVPIVVYVWPSGARAASAGVLISLAAHVAAMAPGTNIGAAHPVSIGGGETNETMEEKITNDAAAYARSIAAKRGRNVGWAERVVRESISSTAEEAVDSNVVDFVAPDLDELLALVDGDTIEVAGGNVVLHTAHTRVVEMKPSIRERFLTRISDPNIAYLLMLLGIFGIVFELQNPGGIFPGVIGVISILMAAFALQLLPVNLVGLSLIGVSIVLFVLETQITSGGMLTIGGGIAMLIGSIMLIDSPLPFMRVSLTVIIPSVIFTVLFFLFAVGLGIKAQRRKVSTGTGGMVGERGVAKTDIHTDGSVFLHGEYWNAYSDENISKGAAVEVVAVDGMKVKVVPAGRQ